MKLVILWIGTPPDYAAKNPRHAPGCATVLRARLIEYEDWETGEIADREIEVEEYRGGNVSWYRCHGPRYSATMQALALCLLERSIEQARYRGLLVGVEAFMREVGYSTGWPDDIAAALTDEEPS